MLRFRIEDMAGPSAPFAAEHWTVTGLGSDEQGPYWHVACDRYDRKTRTCGAGDALPPICSGYPWYGREPRLADLAGVCGYMRDARLVLPLEVLR